MNKTQYKIARKELRVNFIKEQARWELLKNDEHVFTSAGGYLDIDYFHHRIKSIDVDGRSITAIDYSQGKKEVVLKSFETLDELAQQGVTFDITELNKK